MKPGDAFKSGRGPQVRRQRLDCKCKQEGRQGQPCLQPLFKETFFSFEFVQLSKKVSLKQYLKFTCLRVLSTWDDNNIPVLYVGEARSGWCQHSGQQCWDCDRKKIHGCSRLPDWEDSGGQHYGSLLGQSGTAELWLYNVFFMLFLELCKYVVSHGNFVWTEI